MNKYTYIFFGTFLFLFSSFKITSNNQQIVKYNGKTLQSRQNILLKSFSKLLSHLNPFSFLNKKYKEIIGKELQETIQQVKTNNLSDYEKRKKIKHAIFIYDKYRILQDNPDNLVKKTYRYLQRQIHPDTNSSFVDLSQKLTSYRTIDEKTPLLVESLKIAEKYMLFGFSQQCTQLGAKYASGYMSDLSEKNKQALKKQKLKQQIEVSHILRQQLNKQKQN